MGVALQEPSCGDVDLGDRRGTAEGHLVVEEEAGGTDVGSLVPERSLLRDRTEESTPDISELGEGIIDGGTLELTPESEHVAEGGKAGGLGPDVDLESVFSIGHTVDGGDHGLNFELGWQRGEVRCRF